MAILSFGGLRVTVDSKEHNKALTLALEKGCEMVNTSPSYMEGKSEELIGKVLSENPSFNPVIVTKGGFINGEVQSRLKEKGLFDENILKVSEGTFYSLGKGILENQIDQSLKRLRKNQIDIFLLENPETYFLRNGIRREDIYKILKEDFLFLQKMVKSGKIKSFGVSSNNFTLHPEDKNFIDIEMLLDISKKNGLEESFKWIEFPLNLLERSALEKNNNDKSLVDKAKANGLKTIITRPLNAFEGGDLVRLATYDNFFLPGDYTESQKKLEDCINFLSDTILEEDGEISKEDYWVFTSLRAHWVNLHTEEEVINIFNRTIFPFIKRLGNKKYTKEIESSFEELKNLALKQVRQYMTVKAKKKRIDFTKQGIIPDSPEKDLAVLAFETYVNWGVDCISIGMKRLEYVKQLSRFF